MPPHRANSRNSNARNANTVPPVPNHEVTKMQSTAFHPQTDGHAERTIQALKDMLIAYVIDFKNRVRVANRISNSPSSLSHFLVEEVCGSSGVRPKTQNGPWTLHGTLDGPFGDPRPVKGFPIKGIVNHPPGATCEGPRGVFDGLWRVVRPIKRSVQVTQMKELKLERAKLRLVQVDLQLSVLGQLQTAITLAHDELGDPLGIKSKVVESSFQRRRVH
ncbi:hypothetical protein MTR67_051188 [Solanum verrucosum]|uniref:Integrase catalytic domain-containing protein n=1 Tax=Solanum verrucosum TaxID=315347 RepID=A0AAF0V2U5_SOLVR|nr:hypothetical protein MTR67_051188 [Solanum verrucosum]